MVPPIDFHDPVEAGPGGVSGAPRDIDDPGCSARAEAVAAGTGQGEPRRALAVSHNTVLSGGIVRGFGEDDAAGPAETGGIGRSAARYASLTALRICDGREASNQLKTVIPLFFTSIDVNSALSPVPESDGHGSLSHG